MKPSRGLSRKLVSPVIFIGIGLVGCGSAQENGIFENADFSFEVREDDYRNCLTGGVLVETPSPEHSVTRAGLRWHDDGKQLDFLLEYGGIDEYRDRNFTSLGIIDETRPFHQSNDGSEYAIDRSHFGILLEWGDRNSLHDHFWSVTSDGEWIRDPSVIRYGEEFEITGNQVRITVPISLMGVTGPNDPGLDNLNWHVSTGDEDDGTLSQCASSALEDPWPVNLEALDSLRGN